MILSDTMIRTAREDGRLVITGLDDSAIKPASVDLTLAHSFLELDGWTAGFIDPRNVDPMLYLHYPVIEGEFYELLPGKMVLGSTQQIITLNPKQISIPYYVPARPEYYGNKEKVRKYCHRPPLVGRIEGKSSLARIGLMAHISAGFIDPGFCGTITLEFFNCSPLPIRLYPGMAICQVSFFETGTIDKDYTQTGQYNNQCSVTGSKGVK